MPLRPARVLLGHMPLPEAEAFLRGRSPDVPSDGAAFRSLWEAAREAAQGGPAANLDAQPRPLAPSRHTKRLAKQPAFQRAVEGLGWSLETVRIDALLAVQRRVDEGYAADAAAPAKGGGPDASLEVTLPLKTAARPLDVRVEGNTIAVSTDSLDLRVLEPYRAHDGEGDRTTVGFTLGWGAPYVMVARLGGRHVLKNGYHRVYGVRALGVDRVAAVVFDARAIEDAGVGRPGFAGVELLESQRPPTVASFFDDRVCVSARVPTATRVVRVSALESVGREGEP